MSSSASTPFQAKLKKWFSKALGRNNRGSGINTDIRNNNNKKRNTATSDPGSSSGKPGETSANRCYCCDSAAPMRCELDAEFPAVLRRGRRCSSCLAAVTSNPRPNTFEAYGSSPHQTSTPRSVTLSSPESAYGSGNSEDGVSHLSCSLSRTSDCRCFRGHLHHKSTPAALHRQHKHSCAGGARLSQHNPEDSGIILDDSAGNGKNGGGRESRAGGAASSSSSGAAERPKIRTNPWVSFSGSQQQLTEWFAVSKTQSLAASSAAEFQRRAARYSSSASLVMTSSNSSHNNSNKRRGSTTGGCLTISRSGVDIINLLDDELLLLLLLLLVSKITDSDDEEQQQGANKNSRLPGESAVTGPAATSGVNFVRGTVATKSLTIPASTGLSGSAGFTKLQQQQGFPSGRTRVAKRTLDCPRCLLMAKQVPMSCLDCYRDKSWESQLCAYCRSWLLAEGDSTPDVNSDSDYNDADTSSSSLSVIFDTSNNNNNNNNSSSSRLMMSTPLREIVKQPPVVEPRLYQQNPHHHHLGKPPLHDHQPIKIDFRQIRGMETRVPQKQHVDLHVSSESSIHSDPAAENGVDLLLDAEEEEEGGVSGSVSGSVRCLSAAAGTAMMMTTTTNGNKLGTYSTLEEKLNQLRLERRLLEAKIRDAVEEDQLKFVTGWKPRSVSVPRH
ncbi:unnamed protein product, partial [Notodromas monacha]